MRYKLKMREIIHLIALVLALTWVVTVSNCEAVHSQEEKGNLSNADKDMYVIHATVYEVGILTNKTSNITHMNNTGQEESVTFFHTDGNNVDLGSIPQPLLTNVTAHSVVGVAPVDRDSAYQVGSKLNQLPSIQHPTAILTSGTSPSNNQQSYEEKSSKYKRSLDYFIQRMFKRAADNETLAKVTKGSAILPSELGVHSIGLPPLLSLNNNLSHIPVPIPNTSVVKYAKVNTLVQSP